MVTILSYTQKIFKKKDKIICKLCCFDKLTVHLLSSDTHPYVVYRRVYK